MSDVINIIYVYIGLNIRGALCLLDYVPRKTTQVKLLGILKLYDYIAHYNFTLIIMALLDFELLRCSY